MKVIVFMVKDSCELTMKLKIASQIKLFFLFENPSTKSSFFLFENHQPYQAAFLFENPLVVSLLSFVENWVAPIQARIGRYKYI